MTIVDMAVHARARYFSQHASERRDGEGRDTHAHLFKRRDVLKMYSRCLHETQLILQMRAVSVFLLSLLIDRVSDGINTNR